jgi:hypothetical protein
MAYVIAFDTNDINVLKKAFSCYRIEDGIWRDNMKTARQYVLDDIMQIITSGFTAKKVRHEMSRLLSLREYIQECCDEWIAYRGNAEKCQSLQKEFEDMCRKLRVDVKEVQPYYDNVFSVKRRHDEEERLEREKHDGNGILAGRKSKKPRKTTKAELVANGRREEEYASAVGELAEAIECCSRWRHLVVLSPDLYDDEGDCMQSLLDSCKELDNGNIFAVVTNEN